MNRLARFVILVPLLSMFMTMSLSALAEEPKRSPETRGRRRCATSTAASTHAILTTVCGRSGARIPDGCRWGRCGYWWWADGYWYFYVPPLYGPPEVVSEVAYDEQGNLVPLETAVPVAPVPAGVPPPVPAAALPPPPPPVAPISCGGCDRRWRTRRHCRRRAGPRTGRGRWRSNWRHDRRCRRCGSAARGLADIIGGGGACYYRYPNGAWSPPMGPNYCGY